MDVLREQAEAVAPAEQVAEQLACLLDAAERNQRIDVPELAHQKSGNRQAKVVAGGVAHHKAIASQFLADEVAGAYEPLVAGRDEAKVGKQQNGRVELVGIERPCQRADVVAPCPLQNLVAQ